MIYTKQEILKELNAGNIDFFVYIADTDVYTDNTNAKIVYEVSYGDGNEMQTVLAFTFESESLFVSINGYYSSWDSSTYTDVFLAEPYTFTETRYRKIQPSLSKSGVGDVTDWSVPKR